MRKLSDALVTSSMMSWNRETSNRYFGCNFDIYTSYRLEMKKSKIFGYSLIQRYIGSGLVNTAIGYLVIFLSMTAGLSPIASNVLGYAVGLASAFILGRIWVFRSSGRPIGEAFRFFISFLISYSLNIIALTTLISIDVDLMFSQVVASGIYVLSMLIISALWVYDVS